MTSGVDLASGWSRLIAVLGPTNTGKTHFAIERMLGYESGMIGFPLRLLARENYDKIVKLKGRGRVALVTGEEKIVPPGAQYFVCTVESMPLDRPVAFLAVDEIQLCADPERGHIFTDRLLHARGLDETVFLGAETIRPVLKALLPKVDVVGRQRLSELTHIGHRKLTKLPPRSAIVAFSATDVYQVAELIRRHRGGAAVVLGALSPRTRNAQVAMYQAGEVDYLVATDAIGMGLNMDIDHVAFARLRKFDGFNPRPLRATEIAQIAGRAGRHMSDGTFGTTDIAGMLDEAVVEAVESHVFDPLNTLMWRSTALDFRSPKGLLKSLERKPDRRELRRGPEVEDQQALAILAKDEAVLDRATTPEAVRLLWDVCQVPDFRKMLTDAHTRLLTRVYTQLMGEGGRSGGRLDAGWVAEQIDRLNRTDGDIDSLVQRIAHTRTWTYIAHRGDWLDDVKGWQDRARAVEDRLSDALHDRLTQRFVDRRSAALVKGLKSGADLVGAVGRDGRVLVEGEFVGHLEGLRFIPDTGLHREDEKAILTAARRALREEIAARVRQVVEAADASFTLDVAGDEAGTIRWDGHPIAHLAEGPERLKPGLRLARLPLVDPAARDRMMGRVGDFLTHRIAADLAPLLRLQSAPVSGPAAGIAYQLVEALGAVPRHAVEALITGLHRGQRRQLFGLGVRLGSRYAYLAPLLKPTPIAMIGLLSAVAAGGPWPPLVPAPGLPSVPREAVENDAALSAVFYLPAGPRAVRLDRLEALLSQAHEQAEQGQLKALPALAQTVGCKLAELPALLAALGFRPVKQEEAQPAVYRLPKPPRPQPAATAAKQRRKARPTAGAADGPFAALAALTASR